jgi:hypothetical protein
MEIKEVENVAIEETRDADTHGEEVFEGEVYNSEEDAVEASETGNHAMATIIGAATVIGVCAVGGLAKRAIKRRKAKKQNPEEIEQEDDVESIKLGLKDRVTTLFTGTVKIKKTENTEEG